MPIHLSQLMGDLALAQAEDMIAQAKASGAKSSDALFDVLDPVSEVEINQKKKARADAVQAAREMATQGRSAKADSKA